MKQNGSILMAMVAGLFVAQILATVQIYYADSALYRTMIAISEAGFFTVPNRITLPNLQHFTPAFLGGLFFTLSVGLGVTLCTVAMAWTCSSSTSKGIEPLRKPLYPERQCGRIQPPGQPLFSPHSPDRAPGPAARRLASARRYGLNPHGCNHRAGLPVGGGAANRA